MMITMPPVDLGPDTDLLGDLLDVWSKRRTANLRRSTYYDGEKALKDFGISLPPQMRNVGAALGWIGKGVRALTNRSQFERFVTASGSDDSLGLSEILWENQFDTEFPAACVSSAMHGCSFLTVSHGDLEAGEPDVLVLARAAEDSAAIWDTRKRALAGFLSIIALERDQPVEMVMYTPLTIYAIGKSGGRWTVTEIPHSLGETPAYPLVHDYELRRPLGHSRITRPSMYFADAALRTIVRSEVSAEFYSAPEYWLFGANATEFIGDDKWTALMGRIKALDVDTEAGEQFPDIHRFTGASPQPHTDQLRMFATQFADEMDLDVRFADSANPSSAEAIFAAKESLITGTKSVNRLWGYGAVRAMNAAVRLRDGLDADTEEMRSLRAQFTDPVLVSPTARADAFSKLATAVPGFAETEVGLEYAGLTAEQIVRLRAEQRRASAGTVLDRLTAGSTPAEGEESAGEAALREVQIVNAQLDALGVGVRAGADPADVARRVGLEGIKMTGAVPVSLRVPQDEASGLEEK